jgi:hypothetical protein
MIPNIPSLNELIQERFEGNKSAFATAIGVGRTQVSKVLNNGVGAGSNFFGGLIRYCELERIDFKKYIFLDNSVKKINKV